MRRININNAIPGMVIAKTIYGSNFEVLLNKGVILESRYITQLKSRGFLKIYVEDEDTEDIIIEDTISDKIRIMATKDILSTYTITKAALEEIEADTTDSIMRNINAPKFKRSFQDNPYFKKMCENIGAFIDDLLNQEVLSGLYSIKSFDNYIFEHSIDSAIMSLLMGKRLNLSLEKLKQIAIGEFLHDIGYIFIDENLARKSDKLTQEEYNQIKLHTTYGYELLKDIETIGAASAHIAYQHHERQDGNGYPRGLKGINKIERGDIVYADEEKLIMIAEITAIADFYDACISDRPYRAALPPDLVHELVRLGAVSQYNEELVDCFLRIVPKYPVGSEVKIKNGRYRDFTGIVASLNRYEISKPKVRLLYDNQKKKIIPFEIDLCEGSFNTEMACIS
ncbi:MAG: HD domain-containing protein [Planctomycetes bacterium]|nr:HD domain-containing protein [Planctomycetota bacterium]